MCYNLTNLEHFRRVFMADLSKLINEKAESAQYMIDGITAVIKNCENLLNGHF